MSVQFKSIRWKNLLSTGNVFTEMQIDTVKTTLISGKNGAGKSTAIDAIVFALYGKPFRKINKSQLLNSINQKELVVELDFEVGIDSYTIRRGIKPNLFEVIKNGEVQKKSTDQQTELEKNILKMNYKTFNQIVILGSATYIPFMELEAKDRREVIEDLLDIQVFSTMNTLLKAKTSGLTKQIVEAEHEVELFDTKIEAFNDNAEAIAAVRQQEIDRLEEQLQKDRETHDVAQQKLDRQHELAEQLKSRLPDKSKLVSKSKKIEALIVDLKSNAKRTKSELDFLEEHEHCPTCTQAIDAQFRENKCSQHKQSISEYLEGYQTLKEKLDEVMAEIAEIDRQGAIVDEAIYKIREYESHVKFALGSIRQAERRIKELAQPIEAAPEKGKLDELQQKRRHRQSELEEFYKEREASAAVAIMLKDGGIKTKIIRQYVPVMNQLINSYLAAFDLFVDFQLDESFNETIKSRHRDTFTYRSFSEGEKLRINLAIMLTWRAIAKMRNSVSTNLLILDEVLDGAMDGAGVENLIAALKSINANDNIFVISHRGETFGEMFDDHVQFTKVGNFSERAA
jgi:DNA repair exonuclease SbcCD ATPase subunit